MAAVSLLAPPLFFLYDASGTLSPPVQSLLLPTGRLRCCSPINSHIAITRRNEWIDDLLLAAPFPRRVSCHIIRRRGGCRCSSRRSAPSTGGNQAERIIATGCGLGDADMLQWLNAAETLHLRLKQALDAALPRHSSFCIRYRRSMRCSPVAPPSPPSPRGALPSTAAPVQFVCKGLGGTKEEVAGT